jgi:hypothetical protein
MKKTEKTHQYKNANAIKITSLNIISENDE